MKKIILSVLILAALFFSLSPVIEGKIDKPHPVETNPETVVKLRAAMDRMEGQYLNLQILSSSTTINYDAIRDALSQMEDAARNIRKVNTNEQLDPSLKDLSGQINRLHKFVLRQDPITLRKGINNLYESCFRCHATHAPRM